MLNKNDIIHIAKARFKDAQVLYAEKRYEGAIYICGYAVELALKARICKTLRWKEYRTDRDYTSFKTHNLDVLLHLSGVEDKIKPSLLVEWSIVIRWTPQTRYQSIGKVSAEEANSMLTAVNSLLRKI